ncbi:MAG: MgtC/SapB family protein [Candidatus Margulisbacteria bacterium]|nr:MgtC/SapB family protein [Candidatus Margulisiibacteriota bacterium]
MYASPILLNIDFFLRCGLSIILGGCIGFEREARKKPAGFKTHVLICTGATIFTFISLNLTQFGDPGRIAAQIVSGIGFIGAGTIFTARHAIQGLTTAATIWVVAAIGMLIGSGHIIPALSATFLITSFMIFSKSTSRTGGKKREAYTLSIKLNHVKALERIETLIHRFNIVIQHKALVKNDGIYLQLTYLSTPATQYLFLKRVLTVEGVSDMMKI